MAPGAGEELLQIRLVVDARRERLLDLLRERGDDRVLDRREAVLEEERTECRLDHRRQDVAVLREPLELHVQVRRGPLYETPPEIQLAGHLGAGRARDDVRADLREPPLGEVRVPRVERVRNRQLEDAVAEELEPLVRGATVARPRCMGENRPGELWWEPVDQLREVSVRGYWCEVT